MRTQLVDGLLADLLQHVRFLRVYVYKYLRKILTKFDIYFSNCNTESFESLGDPGSCRIMSRGKRDTDEYPGFIFVVCLSVYVYIDFVHCKIFAIFGS